MTALPLPAILKMISVLRLRLKSVILCPGPVKCSPAGVSMFLLCLCLDTTILDCSLCFLPYVDSCRAPWTQYHVHHIGGCTWERVCDFIVLCWVCGVCLLAGYGCIPFIFLWLYGKVPVLDGDARPLLTRRFLKGNRSRSSCWPNHRRHEVDTGVPA